jgi:DNA-binding NarL/FixJ family response regulator
MVAGGQSNKEIARALGIGLSTVKNTLTQTYWRLGARNRTEAVVWWYRKGAHNGDS